MSPSSSKRGSDSATGPVRQQIAATSCSWGLKPARSRAAAPGAGSVSAGAGGGLPPLRTPVGVWLAPVGALLAAGGGLVDAAVGVVVGGLALAGGVVVARVQ